MKAYLQLVNRVLHEGTFEPNRTGVSTISMFGACIEHDLSQGFPLLTTKTVPYKLVCTELEFFIKGLQNKQWLQERNCHIWNLWPTLEENDLGPIYGVQWRNFGKQSANSSVDQLKDLVDTLKTDPTSRRMVVSAWNPLELDKMALPPCHVLFHVTVIGNKLNLSWFQRSCDVMVGLPFNLASYATLLHLLCLESGYEPGKVIGFFSNVHIYENHIKQAQLQVTREPKSLPTIHTENFISIFDWVCTQTAVKNYQSHPKIDLQVVR